MKKLLPFLLTLFSFGLTAQQTCIPLDNVVWHNLHTQLDALSMTYSYRYQRFWTAEDDTVFDGITYRNLYSSHGGYLGGIRADSVRAWVRPKDSTTEMLALDFTLQVGDTVPTHYLNYFGSSSPFINTAPIITSRDTIMWGGKPVVELQIDFNYSAWMEGVGNISGMFWNAPYYSMDNQWEIFCMEVNDTTVFPTNGPNSGSCELFLSEMEMLVTKPAVFPNPASEWVEVSEKVNFVAFISSDGRMLEVELQEHRIDLSAVPNGIYTMLMRMNDESVRTEKLVVIHAE